MYEESDPMFHFCFQTTWTIERIIDSSHCFLAINSSVNFFIYIIRGGKFREVILQVRQLILRTN